MTIRTVPDRFLRNRAKAVQAVGDTERNILKEMAETMYINNGVGLAAVQVGIDKQLAVIDIGEGLVKMVNPVIIKKEGNQTMEEGCLSVPETSINVKRAKRVTVSFLNESGEPTQLVAEGLFARAIQHEVDHLTGRLILDYLNPIKRLFAKRGGRRT